MDGQAGKSAPLTFALHASALFLVALWVLPTFGLLVSSFRDGDQIAASGWWTSLSSSEQILQGRTGMEAKPEGDKFVITGNLFGEGEGTLTRFGVKAAQPEGFAAGEEAPLPRGWAITVQANGDYKAVGDGEWTRKRGARIFYKTIVPPRFSAENYLGTVAENGEREGGVLLASGLARAFFNSLTVTIPATIIPILVAAFAAYALSWMQFPGRGLLIAVVVGLLVVPLQMSLIPLLKMYTGLNLGKTYLGMWLAHMGFGLPLAIYMLRNYMAGLPKEIMESARVDGASDFDIFLKIILPLSFPALAAFAIFQFLWVWNDLLVARVFLGVGDKEVVLTAKLNELLGSRGGDWEIMSASAFVTIIVPLIVFFALQRFMVRGLLAGSVK